MTADILTKALGPQAFTHLRPKLLGSSPSTMFLPNSPPPSEHCLFAFARS